MRYHVLDLLRQYADERLEGGARQDILRRHFRYYEALAGKDRSHAGAKATWLNEIEADTPNICASLLYGLAERLPPTAIFLSNVAHYWQIRGHITEGQAWFRRFVDHAEAFSPDSVALALRRAATFATIQGDYGQAIAFGKRARELYTSLKDTSGEAEALHAIAVIEHSQGDSTSAGTHYAEAAEIFRKADHLRGLVVALINLATVSLEKDEPKVAVALLSESQAISTTLNDPEITSTVLSYQGLAALRTGDLQRANETLNKALAMKQRLQDSFGIIEVENRLAGVRLAEGKLDEADRLLRASLRKARRLDAPNLVIHSYERLAELLLHQKNFEQADRSIGLASGLRQQYCYRQASEVNLASIRASLDATLEKQLHASVRNK